MTVVELSKSEDPAEFNLQFTRLNLGMILNSGEKLNAMVGNMRELCFGTNNIGSHPFLSGIRIPTRRFAREQVAAQILAQSFSCLDKDEFTSTRHFDLQKFFKQHRDVAIHGDARVERMKATLDILEEGFTSPDILRNRAITVSVVLLAMKLDLDAPKAKEFGQFIEEFLCLLRWQVKKGLDVDPAYRYLIDFNKHVTQASVEKSAVRSRAKFLEEEFAHWQQHESLSGDAQYSRENDDADPKVDCRK